MLLCRNTATRKPHRYQGLKYSYLYGPRDMRLTSRIGIVRNRWAVVCVCEWSGGMTWGMGQGGG